MSLCQRRNCLFSFILALSVYTLVYGLDDDEFIGDTPSTLIVEHSFDQGINPVFKKRGVININSVTSGIAQYRQDGTTITDDDIAALREAARNGGIYRLRVRSKRDDVTYVSSFVKACSLLESELSDVITVSVDSTGFLLGVSLHVSQPYCTDRIISDSRLHSFSTVVEVVQTSQGPSPDTQSYLAKIERDRAEKQKQAQGQGGSFLSRYWMYIVPVVIFMLVAQSVDPNAQGGSR